MLGFDTNLEGLFGIFENFYFLLVVVFGVTNIPSMRLQANSHISGEGFHYSSRLWWSAHNCIG